MKFNYVRYGKDVLRPVIPIIVKKGEQKLGYRVLVDSGADMCLFHAEVAEALGIDVSKGKMGIVTGVGGKSSTYYIHKLMLDIGGWPIEMDIGFLPSIGGRNIPYGIVGQKGFFENFIVKFDLKKEEVELRTRT